MDDSLAAQYSGDAGGNGSDEDPADGNEQVGEPPLGALRVVGVSHAEVHEGHQEASGVDQRVECRVRDSVKCRGAARAEHERAGSEKRG